jgi:hypothetical protein
MAVYLVVQLAIIFYLFIYKTICSLEVKYFINLITK